MDGSDGYRLLFPYRPDRILRADFSYQYNRRKHNDATLEEEISITWKEKVSKNPTLFNGSKFRFAGVEVTDTTCTLRLGLTDYKTYQGTHKPPDPLRRFGEACMAMPLGNVVIPRTTDGKTFCLVRSGSAGEGRGACVFPGGHPEPSAIYGGVADGDNASVEHELWDGARRELLEELFVGDAEVAPVEKMRFLGLVSRSSDAKVTAVFSADVFLSAEEVGKRYHDANVEEEESVRLIVKELCELRDVVETGKVEADLRAMPELVGAAELWTQMITLQ